MRSQTTWRLWPPPAAHPPDDGDDDLGHGADEALHLEDVQAPALGPDPALVDGVGRLAGGVLVARAAADALVAAGAERPLAVAAGALGPGPLPVRSTTPTSAVRRAWSSTRWSSSTVWGRKAFITSGRSNATRTQPRPTARW